MKNKIYFITFGNEKYYELLNKIQSEAISFNIFDKIIIYKDTDLVNFTDFWEKNNKFILNNDRGFGYWIWKSYITFKTLELMNENDILVYADAGCTLNKNGMERLNEYIEIVKNNECGNISFQMDNNLEKTWTKMDIFNYFNINNTHNYYFTSQLVAGIFVMRKCPITINIATEWYNIMSNNYNLIDDSPSKLTNDSSFIENRHDQSIFSILRKKHGTIILNDETNTFIWNVEQYLKFPIWRKRT